MPSPQLSRRLLFILCGLAAILQRDDFLIVSDSAKASSLIQIHRPCRHIHFVPFVSVWMAPHNASLYGPATDRRKLN